MSHISSTYTYVERLLSERQAYATQFKSSGDGINFPYFNPDPNNPDSEWTLGKSFNISVYHSDGTLLSPRELLDRLQDILGYSANGDTMNFNSIMDAAGFLMNLGNVWKKLPADTKSQIQNFLNLPGPGGKSIISIITEIGIPAIIQGTYWKSGGDYQKTLDIAQKMVDMLKSYVDDGFKQLTPMWIKTLQLYGPSGDTLRTWMQQNPSGSLSFNDFAMGKAFEWQAAFACNSGTADYLNAIRSLELNALLHGVTDPFQMYILIMYVLMDQTNDSQTAISGQGSLTNYLSVPLGHNAKEIANLWSASNFTGKTAQDFYNYVMRIELLAGNQSIASIRPQLDAIYQALTNPSNATQINVTFKDVNGKDQTTTLAALFQAAKGTGPDSPQWKNVALAMNALQPSANNGGGKDNPSFPTQPGFATLSNLVQQVSNSITSKSTAVGQILQYNQGVFEKELSFIQAAALAMINVNKTILQNMGQANA